MTTKKFIQENFQQIQQDYDYVVEKLSFKPYELRSQRIGYKTQGSPRNTIEIVLVMMYLDGEVFVPNRVVVEKAHPNTPLLPLTLERLLRVFDPYLLRQRIYTMIIENEPAMFSVSSVAKYFQPKQQSIYLQTSTLLYRTINSALVWHVKHNTMPIQRNRGWFIFTTKK